MKTQKELTDLYSSLSFYERWEKEDARAKVERDERWADWCGNMPYMSFPADWAVQMLPPFHGAMLRFRVKKDEKIVDVYLDVYQRLGAVREAYWEALPLWEGDSSFCGRRYLLEETDNMITDIQELFHGKEDKWV